MVPDPITLFGMLTFPLFVLIVLFTFLGARDPGQKFYRRLAIGFGIFLILNTATVLYLVVAGVDPGKPLLDRVFQDVLNMAVVAVGLGLMLYVFRSVDRALYGLAEILFGAAAAAFIGWQAEADLLARFVALGAAVYIVVRGMDNYVTGRKTDGGTHFTRWLSARLPRNSPEPAEVVPEKPSPEQADDPMGSDRS